MTLRSFPANLNMYNTSTKDKTQNFNFTEAIILLTRSYLNKIKINEYLILMCQPHDIRFLTKKAKFKRKIIQSPIFHKILHYVGVLRFLLN